MKSGRKLQSASGGLLKLDCIGLGNGFICEAGTCISQRSHGDRNSSAGTGALPQEARSRRAWLVAISRERKTITQKGIIFFLA